MSNHRRSSRALIVTRIFQISHQLRLREKSIDSGSGDAWRNGPGAIPREALIVSTSRRSLSRLSQRFRFGDAPDPESEWRLRRRRARFSYRSNRRVALILL
jgi:hypothetical protein